MTFKGEPVVVQGTAVASPYDHSTPAPSGAATGQAASDPAQHGEKQVGSCSSVGKLVTPATLTLIRQTRTYPRTGRKSCLEFGGVTSLPHNPTDGATLITVSTCRFFCERKRDAEIQSSRSCCMETLLPSWPSLGFTAPPLSTNRWTKVSQTNQSCYNEPAKTPHLFLWQFSDFGKQLHWLHHCSRNSWHHRVGVSGLDATRPDVHARGLNQGVACGNDHIKRGHGGHRLHERQHIWWHHRRHLLPGIPVLCQGRVEQNPLRCC